MKGKSQVLTLLSPRVPFDKTKKKIDDSQRVFWHYEMTIVIFLSHFMPYITQMMPKFQAVCEIPFFDN